MASILNRIRRKIIRLTASPVKYAKIVGVSFGNDLHIYGTIHWGSEPWIITLGNNDHLTDGVSFLTHDAAVGQDKVLGIINICSGHPEKLADRVERFIKENNYEIKLKYGAFPDRPYDSKAVWGDSRKIETIMKGGSENGSDQS